MSNNSIRPIDRTLSGLTTLGQSGPGSNGNERGIPNSQKLQDWSLTIRWFNVIFRTLIGRVLPLCRDADSVFYSPS